MRELKRENRIYIFWFSLSFLVMKCGHNQQCNATDLIYPKPILQLDWTCYGNVNLLDLLRLYAFGFSFCQTLTDVSEDFYSLKRTFYPPNYTQMALLKGVMDEFPLPHKVCCQAIDVMVSDLLINCTQLTYLEFATKKEFGSLSFLVHGFY